MLSGSLIIRYVVAYYGIYRPMLMWLANRHCVWCSRTLSFQLLVPAVQLFPLSTLDTAANAECPCALNLLQADVFSFAMMMYEIMQQYIVLLAVSVQGTYEELEEYCARVAGGYRPPLLEKWPPELISVITVSDMCPAAGCLSCMV